MEIYGVIMTSQKASEEERKEELVETLLSYPTRQEGSSTNYTGEIQEQMQRFRRGMSNCKIIDGPCKP